MSLHGLLLHEASVPEAALGPLYPLVEGDLSVEHLPQQLDGLVLVLILGEGRRPQSHTLRGLHAGRVAGGNIATGGGHPGQHVLEVLGAAGPSDGIIIIIIIVIGHSYYSNRLVVV